jgi:hypothetical protein
MELPDVGTISEVAVVSVTSPLALRLPLPLAVSGRVWPGLSIQGRASMARVKELKRIFDILVERGLGEERVSAEHEVLYIPLFKIDDREAKRLKALGLHWSREGKCWAVFT